MSARMLRLSLVVSALIFSTTSFGWALFEIGGTKEQHQLKYDVLIGEHKNGNLSIDFTLLDEGRLKPLTSVVLVIRSDDGNGFSDLNLPLAMRTVKGKQNSHFQMKRKLAERAMIMLLTKTVDGKEEVRGGAGHAIEIADYIDPIDMQNKGSDVAPESGQKTSN